MIKVTLTYPRRGDVRFDTDYYLGHHVPLAARVFGALGVRRIEVEVVVDQVRATEPDVFAVTNQYWDSLEQARAAFADPSVAQVRSDAHNFYDAGPPTVRYSTLHIAEIPQEDANT
ncbi:EthD family reductase [Nocardia sp. NPDC050408]|uniref:EthD family reductase n=1 Tax=Nocardia sp. NPDC050408 TaxID=3364319 RepID=UPI0037B339E2